MLTVIFFSDPWRELPPLIPIPKPFESIGHASSEMSPLPLLLITPPWKENMENIGRTDPKFFNNFSESFGHASSEMSTSPPSLTPINQMRKYPFEYCRYCAYCMFLIYHGALSVVKRVKLMF